MFYECFGGSPAPLRGHYQARGRGAARGAARDKAWVPGADAVLSYAWLAGANLTEARLAGANLAGAVGLTRAQVDAARGGTRGRGCRRGWSG